MSLASAVRNIWRETAKPHSHSTHFEFLLHGEVIGHV